MTPVSIQNTLAELNELSAFFLKAESTIKQGGAVDMSGMDTRISEVCRAVQNAMPEQQQQYLPELNALLNLLNSCETAIRTMQPDSSQTESPSAQSGEG